jgi:hypothetical protein
MEFNAELLQLIFIAVFIVGVVTLFRVKYLLKKSYPEQHNEIFGNSLLDYSASNSIKIVRFSLSKKEWEFIQEGKLLAWLRFYRFISLIFYSIIFFAVMYMVVMVVAELMKNGT